MTKDQSRTFVNDKTYFINGEFDDEMRKDVVWNLEKHINELKDKKSATLTFYISSPGGDANLLLDLVELFEQAKKHGIVIKTIITSHAYSAGSMLAIAGTKGERYIAKYAEHLAHYGQWGGRRFSDPVHMDRENEFYKRWNATMVDFYNKYSKIPDIKEKLSSDGLYITAEESIKWGLADKYTEELSDD